MHRRLEPDRCGVCRERVTHLPPLALDRLQLDVHLLHKHLHLQLDVHRLRKHLHLHLQLDVHRVRSEHLSNNYIHIKLNKMNPLNETKIMSLVWSVGKMQKWVRGIKQTT